MEMTRYVQFCDRWINQQSTTSSFNGEISSLACNSRRHRQSGLWFDLQRPSNVIAASIISAAFIPGLHDGCMVFEKA